MCLNVCVVSVPITDLISRLKGPRNGETAQSIFLEKQIPSKFKSSMIVRHGEHDQAHGSFV